MSIGKLAADGGLERIDGVFAGLRRQNRKALIPFVTAGDPRLAVTGEIVRALARGGADLIELGIPYSDPLADGPTIQKAAARSLGSGTTLTGIFEMLSGVAGDVDSPILLMTYYNSVYRFGVRRFVEAAARVGVAGLIIPDLPPEEAGAYRALAGEYGLATVFLAAPTSTSERLRRVAAASSGFIYCVSLTGVTGVREHLAGALPEFLQRARQVTDLPLAVGFGISTPRQAREVAHLADGVIVGSAIVNLVERLVNGGENRLAADFNLQTLTDNLESFVGELRRALDET